MEDKKRVSQAQKRATAKFEKTNYDKVLVRFPKGIKERIAESGADSINGFIVRSVIAALDAGSIRQEKQDNRATLEDLQEELNRRRAAAGIKNNPEQKPDELDTVLDRMRREWTGKEA